MATTAETRSEKSQMPWREAWSVNQARAEVAIARSAVAAGIDRSALRKLVLLHLPRFQRDELNSTDVIEAEAARLAGRIFKLQNGFSSWLNRPKISSLLRTQVALRAVPDCVATAIQVRFHYLGVRRQGIHFGLYHSEQEDLPAVLATMSPLDVNHLIERLDDTCTDAQGSILSRIFAFPWAPRNSITALLGALRRLLQSEHPGRSVLFTYVNPNLEFAGTSYRAASWREDGTKPVQYRYIGGNYITACEAMYHSEAEIIYSQFELEPLRIWRCDL